MEKIIKNPNNIFVINFFKSVGITCALIATSACSDNIVNKTNRGNEIMKSSESKIEEKNMDNTNNESIQETKLKNDEKDKNEDYVKKFDNQCLDSCKNFNALGEKYKIIYIDKSCKMGNMAFKKCAKIVII